MHMDQFFISEISEATTKDSITDEEDSDTKNKKMQSLLLVTQYIS